MASRQNRETRKEYPTGHNKGNDSPSRTVPRTNGGTETADEERARLLGTQATPEERRGLIEEHISEGQEETRQRAETEAANRRTEAPEEPSPTADLTVTTAIDRIKDRQRQQQETDR